MNKLNKLYQIESALTTCSLSIPMGLRKESQLGIAMLNVEELIEVEIKETLINKDIQELMQEEEEMSNKYKEIDKIINT